MTKNRQPTRRRVKAGDIFAVPLAPDLLAVGIVLFISRQFRSMMVGFYSQAFRSLSEIDADVLGGDFVRVPNYTATQIISVNERWPVITNRQDLLARAKIPELRVVYSVYYKDEVVRSLTREEFSQYPELSGEGYGFVENALRDYFRKHPLPP